MDETYGDKPWYLHKNLDLLELNQFPKIFEKL